MDAVETFFFFLGQGYGNRQYQKANDPKIWGNQLNRMVHQSFFTLRIWGKYLKGT